MILKLLRLKDENKVRSFRMKYNKLEAKIPELKGKGLELEAERKTEIDPVLNSLNF